ncbi:GNAT family N-acetyltransferase [Chloroflexota bacterium]
MINGSKIRLREKQAADAFNDYSWLIDIELAKLDASPLLTTTFREYLLNHAGELDYSSPTRHRFAIETLDGKHIGNCTYYGIDETKGEAELGIMIGNRDYWNREYGTDTVTTLVNYIFRQTSLNRIYLKTLDFNIRAQNCFKKCGFIPCGHLATDGFSFLLMEIYREHWPEQAKQAEKE